MDLRGNKGRTLALEDRVRRSTVDEFERMHRDGYFEDERRHLELLDGRIVYKVAPTEGHVVAVDAGKDALEAAFGSRYWVRAQAPLRFAGLDSVPEPDLAV